VVLRVAMVAGGDVSGRVVEPLLPFPLASSSLCSWMARVDADAIFKSMRKDSGNQDGTPVSLNVPKQTNIDAGGAVRQAALMKTDGDDLAYAASFSGATKSFGTVHAVDNLSLQVQVGEVLGLVGPNGAGKTTAIQMLLGLTAPTNGTVRVFGQDPRRNTLIVRAKTGVVMQRATLDPNPSGRENLQLYAELYPLDPTG
jgi:ABC-type glutathione transport system ATPase component